MQWLFSWRRDRPLKRIISFILMLFMGAIAVSCVADTPKRSQSVEPSAAPVTQTIRLAVIPVRNSAEQSQNLEALQGYLEKNLKQPIDIQITKNYDAAVDLLVTEKVEMAYLGALTYIKAREQNANLEPLVVPIDQVSGRPWYTSVIVVKTDSKINSLSDLNGKRFAFVSPSSTSGFLMPMNAFQQKGIDPTRDFSTIRYAGSHDNAIDNLTQDLADAIPTENLIVAQAKRDGRLRAADYKVIWESDPIPYTPIVVNTQKLSSEVITRLKQALIDAPSGIANVSGITSNGYTLTKDADFEQIRQIYNRLKSITIPEK